MPDRIIRQSIRTSPTIDMLSFEAESMFYRLMTVADDFGRFEADPRLLLSNIFPLKVDRLKITQVSKWFEELLTSGLVKRYQIGGRIYGFIINWAKHQRGRALVSRFPEPPDDDVMPQPLTEESNTCEQDLESDNLCCQPTTDVARIRYSIIEKNDNRKEERLLSETSADAESLDEPEPSEPIEEPLNTDKLVDSWNSVCGPVGLPTKSARGRQNPQLRQKTRLRLQTYPDRYYWTTVLTRITETPFLRGDKGWKATFDWLVENDQNSLKVFEGNYAEARASPNGKVDAAKQWIDRLTPKPEGTPS